LRLSEYAHNAPHLYLLQIYDYSIIPRITITVITALFAVIAGVFAVMILAEPKQVRYFTTFIPAAIFDFRISDLVL
jgi:hypothetical protein